jgi:hypothetical protein
LVGGEPAAKPAPRATTPAEELPLEPIDLSDIEVPATRRAGPGVAGTRLQPAEIAATLALASAAQQPAHTAASALNGHTPAHTPNAPFPEAAERPAAAPEFPVASAQFRSPENAATPATPAAAATPAEAPAAAAAPLPAAAPAPAINPETYLAAALHAQHLQHQLAMAELRNQHLLEQQQMLREMLSMTRQAMV